MSHTIQSGAATLFYSVLQCVAVCCSVLQRIAAALLCIRIYLTICSLSSLLIYTVCCSVLQCVAVCCDVLQCVAVCCSVLQPVDSVYVYT